MIDEKINKTLTEMEANLAKVESARKQVESTVGSFNGLQAKTSEYVNSLTDVNKNLKDVLKLVGEDYKQMVNSFKNDRESIMEACNSAISTVNNAAESVQHNVEENISNMQKRFTLVIILNIVILITVVALAFFVK